jgi:four helix bundle protein
MMQNYKKLFVWRKSYDLTRNIYSLTKLLPQKEAFNLISQIEQSSMSICSNISEECSRKTNKNLALFLRNFYGSLMELECQIFFI